MKFAFNPFDLLRPTIEMGQMMIESQQVIALRMAGLAGVWQMGPAENQRMVDEKVAALTEAAKAVYASGMAGASPGDIAMAGLGPLRSRTKANARRLTLKAARGVA